MSIVKSYAVGDGDCFYIDHNSPNLTIIDCNLPSNRAEAILCELASLQAIKHVTRFISTHPDEDHILGLDKLDDALAILNFYCVDNAATKEDMTPAFSRYRQLRNSGQAFSLFKGCQRKWMNLNDETREQSGLHCLWPDTSNEHFLAALDDAEEGYSPNNISPIIQYCGPGTSTALWMGDLESAFLDAISDSVHLPRVDVLFAPHHGRESGKIPATMLDEMSPRIVVVGEAPSQHLHYYPGRNTITQNSAGDLVFEFADGGEIDVYCSNEYDVDFLVDMKRRRPGFHYLGSLPARQ